MKTFKTDEILLFACLFSLYLIFLCPSIFSGDSPLLSLSAFALGPAHPPGYPLYVMLGKIMTLLPFGNVAYKMNLLSAISGAAASLLVFKSVRLLTDDDAISLFAALLSALAPLAWGESTKAEAYTLNSAFVMLIFYLGIRFLGEDADRRLLFGTSFALGLGMANHHTIGFMAIPLALAVLLRARDFRTVSFCLIFLMTGMSVYALSYIRSLKYLSNEALFSYSDASSLDGFIGTFLRRDYHSSVEAIVGPAHNPLNILLGPYNALRYLIYGNIGAFSLMGVFSVPLLWKRKPLLSFVLTAFAAYAVVLASMVYAFREPSADDLFLLDPYMLPTMYISSVIIGLGAFYLLGALARRLPETRRPLALGLALLPLVFVLPDTLAERDYSRHYLVEDYADNTLETLPVQSVLISVSDSSAFPLDFKTFVERKRDDVLVLYGDDRGISTQASPPWKIETLFRDLPAPRPFSQVSTDYLKGRPLFAFEPAFLPKDVQASFRATPFIHSYKLIPAEGMLNDYSDDSEFIRAFEMLVYERSLRERAADMYTAELKMSMFIPVSHYAYIMKKRGEAVIAHKYYEESLKLITPKGLAHYVTYLKNAGKRDEAESFIEAIEPYANAYPEVRKLSEEIRRKFL